MRPKIVFAILLIAAGVIAVAVMLPKVFNPQPVAAPAQVTAPPSNPVPAFKPAVVISTPPVAVANVDATPPAAVTNEDTNAVSDHEEYVSKRSDELMELAEQTSPEAHQQIVNELTNSDVGIRKAALDALEQANDRSVVPQMQQIANQTDDADYKQAIEDAIDFINLPSLSEVMKERKAQKAASGNQSPQTPSPAPGQNQSTGPNQ
jgi:hypothetical protein